MGPCDWIQGRDHSKHWSWTSAAWRPGGRSSHKDEWGKGGECISYAFLMFRQGRLCRLWGEHHPPPPEAHMNLLGNVSPPWPTINSPWLFSGHMGSREGRSPFEKTMWSSCVFELNFLSKFTSLRFQPLIIFERNHSVYWDLLTIIK